MVNERDDKSLTLHGGGQGFESFGSTNGIRGLQAELDLKMGAAPTARGAIV
jgi:hypothetical protein